MADNYAKLTDGEKAYWDVYTRLRELSDWPGFTDQQKTVQSSSREWLQAKRKEIWRLAQPKSDGGDGQGWEHANRKYRYEQLQDDSLNSGSCRRVCQLPTGGMTDREKALQSERETWWLVSSVDDQTKSWRLANSDTLITIRKQIYTLAQQSTWDKFNRKLRWNNLCVATKTGTAYKQWAVGHDTTTGEAKPAKPSAPSSPSSARAKAVANCRHHLGVHERPAGSNKGSPQPDGWQKRVIGSTGYAWCACFATCMAWDAGVKGGSSAGVIVMVQMAQRHQGMFRGWTTNPANVLRGDFAIVGCSSCHVGVVVDSSDPCHLIEGNGNDGGSYNGGEVVEKHRSRSQIVGWCQVDYP